MSCAAPCLAPSVDYFFISASGQNCRGARGYIETWRAGSLGGWPHERNVTVHSYLLE